MVAENNPHEVDFGRFDPDSGSLAAPARMAYLPQDLGLDREQTLAELCGISEILRALQAVESGEYSPNSMRPSGTAGTLRSAPSRLLQPTASPRQPWLIATARRRFGRSLPATCAASPVARRSLPRLPRFCVQTPSSFCSMSRRTT